MLSWNRGVFSMLAMIGSALIVLGMYAFFAVRMPMTWIGAVVGLGIVLMLGQIVKIARQRPVGATKGDASGS
jgi:xanthosine utilization system XapX-like protein